VITQDGNQMIMLGAVSGPTVNTFDACKSPSVCLPASGGQPTVLGAGQSLAVQWDTTHITSGVSLQLYAVNQDNVRTPIAEQYSGAGTQLSGSAAWSTFQNGTYTLTLELYDQLGRTTLIQKGAVVVNDTAAPAAPANLQATARADSSVDLTWNAALMEPDILGYQISVDGTEPIVIEQRVSAYDLYGLDITTAHTVTLAAFDLNGNLGPVSTTTVTLNALSVTSAWPTRGMAASMVDHVTVAFNMPVMVDSFSITTTLEVLPGTTTTLTQEIDLSTTVTVGARWSSANQGRLKPGAYTATITVRDIETNTPRVVSWPFTVIEAPNKIFLPSIQR
jgi:hypothetical protein